MSLDSKQLHNLSRIYQEKVAKTEVDEGIIKFLRNPKATIQKAVDKKLTNATKKGSLGGIKVGGSAKYTGSVGAPDAGSFKTEEKMAKKDYDGDGKVESSKDEYFGSKDKAIKKAMGKKVKMKNESYSDWRQDLKEIPDYDQIPLNDKKRNEKISEKNVKNTIKINPEMKEGYGDKKKKKHDCASKVKHEQFGVGNCISEAHDLDENGNVAHYDVEFEEYIVKNVPVEELEILEGHMHEHTIREGTYEKKKKKEVMGALKKRDLKKDVKKKIAADIVKKKGDTSKSDDRYAYESKLWDEVAAHLTELGNLNDADFRVEGYQRNPEKGEEEARKAKRERKGGYDEKREKRMSSPTRGIDSPAFKEFMRSRGM